jgi:hypothetical protein
MSAAARKPSSAPAPVPVEPPRAVPPVPVPVPIQPPIPGPPERRSRR